MNIHTIVLVSLLSCGCLITRATDKFKKPDQTAQQLSPKTSPKNAPSEQRLLSSPKKLAPYPSNLVPSQAQTSLSMDQSPVKPKIAASSYVTNPVNLFPS